MCVCVCVCLIGPMSGSVLYGLCRVYRLGQSVACRRLSLYNGSQFQNVPRVRYHGDSNVKGRSQ